MYLQQLSIHQLRNLTEVILQLSPCFNLFYGRNGSGKTNVLEAVCVLTRGRSFRTTHAESYIHFKAEDCTLVGHVYSKDKLSHRMGIRRDKKGVLEMRVNGENCNTLAEWVKILPIQVINTEAYQLLSMPSKFRRQFMDWGVFHVEHSFSSLWSRYTRILKQRNAALKRAKFEGGASVSAWDSELIEAGETIHQHRQKFLNTFSPLFIDYLMSFLEVSDLVIDYRRGWDHKTTFQRALEQARNRDLALGYTTEGPHRADLKFLLGGVSAESVLSRGQLKLFVCALFLARGQWLWKHSAEHSIFLLDDVTSELDSLATERLLLGLKALGGQVLLTCIENTSFLKLLQGREVRMFHVEHGRVILNPAKEDKTTSIISLATGNCAQNMR